MGLSQFEEARRMLVRAVAEIKDHQYTTARRYLERMISIPSTGDQKAEAYFWLSEIAETEDEKRDHLHSALAYDLTHHRARKSLAILDGRLKPEEIINPDAFVPTTAEGTQDREGNRFECPTCGARMVFSPDGQSLVCEHCENQKADSSESALEEQEFLLGISTAKGHQQARATQAFECSACGAVYLLAPEILSITCLHCDSTYSIVQAEVRELIPPEGVIPMQLDQDQAAAALREWFLAEYKQRPKVSLESLKGVYLPAWTFDLGGNIKWTGYIEYQENQPIPVRDYGVIHFDDVFVPASKPEPKYYQQLLREFDANDVLPFKPDYLPNWLAESYQVPMADAAVAARALTFKLAQREQVQKSGLSNVQNLQFYSDDILVESFKLVLVPVWIARLEVDGEKDEVLINGKSGRVYAKKPPGLMRRALGWLKDK